MANTSALVELQNQQWPSRRFEKTYGKKKIAMAHTCPLYFNLFGGGDENKIVEETDQLTANDDTDVSTQHLQSQHPLAEKESTELNPRLRGRRKGVSSRKMAVCVYTLSRITQTSQILTTVN